MKRALIILSAVALLLFAGCSAPDKVESDLADSGTDDIMTSGNFNTIGNDSSTASVQSAEGQSPSSQKADSGTDVAAAFSAYQSALNATASYKSYVYSGKQSYSAVLDGVSVVLDSYITDARSNGTDVAKTTTATGKDKHNKPLYSSVDGFYAEKQAGESKVFTKYTDHIDAENSSQLLASEGYSVQSLASWLDRSFDFAKSDVASASVANGESYTFTLKTDRAQKIVSELLGSVDLQEGSGEVSVSYFVVTVRLSEQGIKSYNCSVICTIGEDNTTYKFVSEYETDRLGLTDVAVSKPDWLK